MKKKSRRLTIFWVKSMSQKLTMREILTGHIQPKERSPNLQTINDYPHLKFSNLEHYNTALKKAEELGKEALDSFKNTFASLERICAHQNETAEVFPDCTPYSFYFRTYKEDGEFWIDGGIILHGIGQAFSVELCPKASIHWSMHT